MKNFFIIEDSNFLSTMLSSLLLTELPPGFCLVTLDSCRKVRAKPGDFILTDCNGVDLELLRPNGATVLRMSGDSSRKADLQKPFSVK
jgi:hypothetical protein